MLIQNISDYRRAIRGGAYAWPGGYPLFFITADGAALSFKAARDNRRLILEAIATNDTRGGWRIAALDVNWEDSTLTCDHTGAPIESAYGADS
jgi:hypothetical protein